MEFLMKKYLIYASLTAAMLTAGCDYDNFDDLIPDTGSVLVPNADILFARSLCGDGVYNVTDDIILGGRVTANDKSGNIYRSFFIEDATGAAEIRAGMYSLHNVYVRGRYVSVRLQGLAVTLDNGVFRVGIPPSQGYTGVEYMDSWTVAAEYIVPSDETGAVEPLPLVATQLNDRYCGRLVRLTGMRYSMEDADENDRGDENEGQETRIGLTSEVPVTWAYPRDGTNSVPQSAYRYFTDVEGNTVAVYTSGYASFAGNEVPLGTVSLTGILSYGTTDKGQMFILRLRDAEDIAIQINY